MPACARKELVRDGEMGTYHCIQRCVRRAYLCGYDLVAGRNFDHRKHWIRDRLRELAESFAVEVCGYAIMCNHVHVIVRTRPDVVANWTPTELARRWWRLSPKRREEQGDPETPSATELQGVLDARAGGEERAQELRSRLASLSWFMRCFAEPLARRANREDGCKGRFWEGRFKSQRLLDQAAVLACLAYVDLNPIRAGIAATPEASRFTSVCDRIVAHEAKDKLAALPPRVKSAPTPAQRGLVAAAQRERSCAGWLAPLGSKGSFLSAVSLTAYLKLLDWTGRAIAKGKRGTIPTKLQPILTRLSLDRDHWLKTVSKFGSLFFRVAGATERIQAEAASVGRRWLCGLSAARLVWC